MEQKDLNIIASEWWANLLLKANKRDIFRAELLQLLPNSNWKLQNDYDPQDILLDAVRNCGEDCRGVMCSGDPFFPRKTVMLRKENRLIAKIGRGAQWEEIA